MTRIIQVILRNKGKLDRKTGQLTEKLRQRKVLAPYLVITRNQPFDFS